MVMAGLYDAGSVGMVYVSILVSSSYLSNPRISARRPYSLAASLLHAYVMSSTLLARAEASSLRVS